MEVNERSNGRCFSGSRNHPVGRFWLPIARQARSQFRLIHVAGHPHDSDSVRDQLRSFRMIGGLLIRQKSLLWHAEFLKSLRPCCWTLEAILRTIILLCLVIGLHQFRPLILVFMVPVMADVAIGGLLIMCWNDFFLGHILVQKIFGLCLVRAFAMYLPLHGLPSVENQLLRAEPSCFRKF